MEVGGLSGIEIRGPGKQLTRAFSTLDHTLMISVSGPEERVSSAEVQTLLNSLRRTGDVPPDLAQRAQAAANP